MIGDIIGRVTWRSDAHQPAPSMRAASYSSVGMPRRPARLTMIPAPMPQIPIITSAG